jgi:hypothetical protein
LSGVVEGLQDLQGLAPLTLSGLFQDVYSDPRVNSVGWLTLPWCLILGDFLDFIDCKVDDIIYLYCQGLGSSKNTS